jgi:MFS family permease
MFGMDSTGKLAGPVLGGFIAHEWGIIAPFVVYGALALLALVPALLFAEDTPRRERPAAKVSLTSRLLALRALVMPRLAFFGVAMFAGLTRGPLQADLLHVYAAFVYNLGPIEIGYLATGASILSLPIGFIAGWMMDRFGRKRTMVPGFTGVAVAMVALAVSAFIPLGLGWYVVLFYLSVVMQSLTGGSIQTVGADVAPPEARGRFLGLWRFTGQSGMTLSPIIFVLISEYLGYSTSFFFTALSAAAVAALLIRYVPETR